MRHIVFLSLLSAFLAMPVAADNITWVNDGADGWNLGESVAAADMNEIKTSVDDNYTSIVALDATEDGVADSAASVAVNSVALSTDTTGNYVATIADSGASEVTVAGSGSEGAAVTLAIAASLTRDSELSALTVSTTDVTDLTTACDSGDIYIDTDGPAASGTPRIWFCIDGATNNWAYEDLTD